MTDRRYKTPDGFRLDFCECSQSEPCPNGKTGSAARCSILVRRSKKERKRERKRELPMNYWPDM